MDKLDKPVWMKFIHRDVYKVKMKYTHRKMSINGEDYHNRCVEKMKKSASYPQVIHKMWII